MYKLTVRAIFVGSNPSVTSKRNSAFDTSTKSGKTLHEWIRKANIQTSILINIANHATPKNRPLNAAEIKQSLPRLTYDINLYPDIPAIVAVGKTAVKALTLLGVEFYEMPHPSGLNRLLNDPKYIEEKINGLKNYVEPV